MFLSAEADQTLPPKAMTLQQAEQDGDNTDGRSGFGYSQKFFHISDGNLYSVFSPLQGRCYGVRPAFLRQHSGKSHHVHHSQQQPQQAGPAEEPNKTKESEAPSVRGRGRGQRRGAPASRGRRNRGLKFHNFVPAEKRGPMPAPPDGASGSLLWSPAMIHSECRLREEHGTKQITVSNYWASESPRTPTADEVPSNSTPRPAGLNLQVPPEPTAAAAPSQSFAPVLSARTTPVITSEESSERPSPVDDDRPVVPGRIRHRRKPLQTRQVIPYPTYLSMLHDESPLDLSQAARPLDLFSSQSGSSPGSTSTLEALLLSENNSSSRDQPSHSNRFEMSSLAGASGLQPATSVSRRPSQRTLIRQKLEDTFKQNGFLVKTKQVSDGDATFCKFKQLRKYTRYYLKSWHQHLPEEVHKLWKGFLPPSASPSGTVTVPPPSAQALRTSPKWTEPPPAQALRTSPKWTEPPPAQALRTSPKWTEPLPAQALRTSPKWTEPPS